MAIWGKLFGTAAGFAAGHWVGAFLGGIAGHAFDQWRAEKRQVEATKRPDIQLDELLESKRIAFATAVIVLAAKLAKVDGRVHPDEIRAFKRIFDISDDDVGSVARVYDEAKQSPDGFQPFARQIAAIFGQERGVLEELLDGLFEVAAADGAINPPELAFLKEVGLIFGFGPFQFEGIRARYHFTRQGWQGQGWQGTGWQQGQERAAPAPPANADAYAALGITRSANDNEVKQAWRALVREHHPDRLIAQGLPQEFVAKANRRLQAINAAYDQIAKERGMR